MPDHNWYNDDPRQTGCDCSACRGAHSPPNSLTAVGYSIGQQYGDQLGLRANLRNMTPAEARVAIIGLVEVNKQQIRRRIGARFPRRRRSVGTPMGQIQGAVVGSILKDAFDIVLPHGGKKLFTPKKFAKEQKAREEAAKRAAAAKPAPPPTALPPAPAAPQMYPAYQHPSYIQPPMRPAYQQPSYPAAPAYPQQAPWQQRPAWQQTAQLFAPAAQSLYNEAHDAWWNVSGGDPETSMIDAIMRGDVVYSRHDPNEHWQSFNEVLAAGEGDCEDLSAAVVAEMQLAGRNAFVGIEKSGEDLWHATVNVYNPDGSITNLDPSKWAGMDT